MELMKLKVGYSTLTGDDLLAKIVSQYEIEEPLECVFMQRGVNDTYELRCGDDRKYSIRVYRHALRERDEIDFEMAAISYLHKKGAYVAYPIVKRNGDFVTKIEAPEGIRYVIITAHADGEHLRYKKPDQAVRFGESAATLHKLSEGFNTTHHRPDLDVDYLLDNSLQIIRPYFYKNLDDWTILEKAATEARLRVSSESRNKLDTGFCHGDFHGGNVREADDVITHFDFDCCGMGLRIFDLATFYWSARLREKHEEQWPAFLEGYRSVRSIGEVDLALLDTFVFIRHVWLMSLHMGNADDFGHGLTPCRRTVALGAQPRDPRSTPNQPSLTELLGVLLNDVVS